VKTRQDTATSRRKHGRLPAAARCMHGARALFQPCPAGGDGVFHQR
jgi:hypothetical protein